MRLYKFLRDTKGTPTHGEGAWDMPKRGKPGAWRTEKGPLELCEPGTLHYCEPDQLAHWVAPVLVEVEVRGETVREADKCGALEMRILRRVTKWNARTQRRFAVWCAYGALLAEREAGREPRPASWVAVALAHRIASGKRVSEAAYSAAYSVAYSAADSAARSAAYSAAYLAASSAASSAANSAANSAARLADRLDARLAQSRQILLLCGEVE